MLDVFLEAEDSNGCLLSDRQVLVEIFTVLLRIFAPSVSDTMIKILIHDRHYQQKLVDEQNQIIREEGSEFTALILDKMYYLEATIRETLRLEFTLSSWRFTEDDLFFSDGLAIPKGNFLLMTMGGVNFDEEMFPDPTRWDPDRYFVATQEARTSNLRSLRIGAVEGIHVPVAFMHNLQ